MVTLQKKVAIFVPTYLNLSETFIYNIVSGLKSFTPIVFAKEKKNINRFPVTELHTGSELLWHQRISRDPLRAYGTSAEELKKIGVRLIHAQFGPVGLDLLNLKERWPAMPVITHFRGQDAYQLSRDILSRVRLQKLFRVGDYFLTSSKHLREFLVEQLGCPENKVEHFYGGIDVKHIKFKVRDLKQGRKNLKILMCGRLTEKKGFEYGIRAFFELLARGYNLSLEIVGTGPYESKLKKVVQQLRLDKFVKFLGSMPHDAVLKKLQATDLMLAPYVTAHSGDSEGIPNILKEALAAGVPVVTTRHAGVPELIIDGVNGYLVHEKAVIMLGRKTEELIKDQAAIEKFAHKGREFVEKYFDKDAQDKKLERIYQKFLL